MKLSNRVLEMEESVTLAANARAKALAAEGRDILSLTLGQPDFATPKNIQEAAVASIEDGRASFYTVASGLPELKDAISDYMKGFYGYAVNRNEVVVGTGAKFILYAFFTSVINRLLTSCSWSVSLSLSNHSLRLIIGISTRSVMAFPPIFTHEASFFSFVPWQSGHTVLPLYRLSMTRY